MHFSLTPWRRFPGHSLPLSVLESRSRLSVVRASPTAWSPGTIFRSSRLRARHQITGCPWANKVALFADPSCGEEHRALGPGMESKGRAIGLREPQRGSLISPIEGQTRVGQRARAFPQHTLPPTPNRREVAMTYGALHVSAIATAFLRHFRPGGR